MKIKSPLTNEIHCAVTATTSEIHCVVTCTTNERFICCNLHNKWEIHCVVTSTTNERFICCNLHNKWKIHYVVTFTTNEIYFVVTFTTNEIYLCGNGDLSLHITQGRGSQSVCLPPTIVPWRYSPSVPALSLCFSGSVHPAHTGDRNEQVPPKLRPLENLHG